MTQQNEITRYTPINEPIDRQNVGSIAIGRGGLACANMIELMDFAKLMAVSQTAIPAHLRGNPGACLAVCLQATEWGMSPFAVANKSYSVNDRLCYEAAMYQAVVTRRAPIVGRIQMDYSGEADKRRCKVWAKLTDGVTVSYESPPLSKIKGKSPLWNNDPDQQLFYFSVRAWARRHFQDVMMGLYTVDEMIDAPPAEITHGEPIQGEVETPEPEVTLDSLEDDSAPAEPSTGATPQPDAPVSSPAPQVQEAAGGGADSSETDSSGEPEAPDESEKFEMMLEDAYSQDHVSCKKTFTEFAKNKDKVARSVVEGGMFKYSNARGHTVMDMTKDEWKELHRAVAAGAFNWSNGKIQEPVPG